MSEVWKACKKFLVSAEQDDISGIEKVNSLYDMYSILSDGMLLCNLLNVICPKIVNFYQTGSRVTLYRIIANVTEFIKGCRDELSISENDIFEMSDLIEGEDLNAVFYTLSLVSQSEQSRKMNLLPFFCQKNLPACKLNQDFFSLIEKEKTDDASESVYENPPTACSTYLAENLFIKEFSENFVLDPTNNKEKYDFLVQDFLSNEKRYFEGHIMLMSHLYDYLSRMLSFSELSLTFNNFQNIKNVHYTIIQSFYDNYYKFKKSLGATVIKNKALFLEYVPYISKLQGASIYADRIWKDSKMKRGILETVKDFDPNYRLLDLKSLLTAPMHHVARYKLQFETMLRNCKDKKSAYTELDNGILEITDVLGHINQARNDEASLEDIQILQTRFISSTKGLNVPNLKDFGHILFQSEIFIRFRKDHKKINSKIGLIFDTKLLIAKPNGSKLILEMIIGYNDYSFKPKFNSKNLIVSINVEANPNSGLDTSNNFKISFGSKNYVTDKFMATLTKCLKINNINQNISKMHSLKITNFSNNECCSICTKLLWGLLSQGYHCSNKGCNINVHSACLPALTTCNTETQTRTTTEVFSTMHSKPRALSSCLSETEPLDSHQTLSIEFELEQEDWFCGKCTRIEAQEILSPLMNGSYLVRRSDNLVGKFVLSFKYDNKVGHIKVDHDKGYFVYEFRKFPKIRELIGYYQLNPLVEINYKFNLCLLNPAKGSDRKVVAIFDSINCKKGFLSFKAGDLVTILSDYDENIWIVKIGTEVGYCLSWLLKK